MKKAILLLALLYIVCYLITIIVQWTVDLFQAYNLTNQENSKFPYSSGPIGGVHIERMFVNVIVNWASLIACISFIVKRNKLTFVIFAILIASQIADAAFLIYFRIVYHQRCLFEFMFVVFLVAFYTLAKRSRNDFNIKLQLSRTDLLFTLIGAITLIWGLYWIRNS